MALFSSDAIVSEIGKSLKDNAVDVEIKEIQVLICNNTVKMNKKTRAKREKCWPGEQIFDKNLNSNKQHLLIHKYRERNSLG